MKNKLTLALAVAVGLLSASGAHAQVSSLIEFNQVPAGNGLPTTTTLPGRITEYYWNASSQQWYKTNVGFETRTYDARGRVTQRLTADSATNVPIARILYTYDA
jgi:hypothetical protein